jgi:glycosyltransferase involved in cell wall biosynthesis
MNSEPTRSAPDISVIVPISEPAGDVQELYLHYLDALDALDRSYELIFVVDAGQSWIVPQLREIRSTRATVEIVVLGRTFGEAAALSVGFSRARAERVVTLPAYPQVDGSGIVRVLEALEAGPDIVTGRRHPRTDSAFNRLQTGVFHGFVRALTRAPYRDISCGLRAMRREAARELEVYGDLHRFIPIIAESQGFSVAECNVEQSGMQKRWRVQRPGAYVRRVLDLLTVFFLAKFTRKPLRFFGLIGTTLFVPGVAIVAYLGIYRLLGLGGIGDRPLLLLGVLLMVLGFQTLSIGLLGEIIIFVHARDLREYSVAEVISRSPGRSQQDQPAGPVLTHKE